MMMRVRVLAVAAACVVTLSGCTTWRATVTHMDNVPGIDASVEHRQGTLWQVKAKNTSNQPAKLVWDESSYVSTSGESSRLVRGKTRVIHSGQTQPPSPIPPNATITELFVPEMHISSSGASFYTPAPSDPSQEAQIYLMFEVNGRKTPWTARVRFEKPSNNNLDN